MDVSWLKEMVEELSFHLASELKDLEKVKLAVRIAYGDMVAKLFDDVIRESVDEWFMEERAAWSELHMLDDDYGGG